MRATGCVWRAWYDRDAINVLNAYAWFAEHQVREYWGDDPPAWLVRALDRYRAHLSAVRADVLTQDRIRRERAAAASPPNGWTVEGSGHG